MPRLLAIDLGTSSCKVVLYADRTILATATEPLRTTHPAPGLAEQDPDACWAAVVRASARALDPHGPAVDAIGVTGQSDSLVAIDDAGRAVWPSILWMDGRGTDELRMIRDALGDQHIHEVTGLRPALSFTAAKVAWLRHHEPAAFARMRWALQPKDHLVQRLTGVAVTDPSSASRSMFYDRRSGTWWPEMLDLIGLDKDRLPVIRASGAAAGGVTVASARELGIAAGTPVAVGAADRAAEALATGVTHDEAMVSMGTAAGTVMSIPATLSVADAAILTPAHALPGRSMALMSVATSGAVLQWLVSLLGGPDADGAAHAMLLDEAAASVPGARGVTLLPFFMGAKSVRWSQDARGVIGGLDLSTGRGDLMRAAVEGICFEIAACLRRLATARGPVGRIVLVGGGQQGDFSGQLLVDVTGIPALRLDRPHAAAAGAMLLAGQALGAWSDPLAEALADRHGPELLPRSELRGIYRTLSERYESLCEAVGLTEVRQGLQPPA